MGCSSRDLSRNQIALVEIGVVETQGSRPRANLIRLIGPVGEFDAERKALLLHYGSPAAFKKIDATDPVDVSHDGQRMEICSETGWFTYHVDPIGCRDIDDAIAYNRETGETAITIADATAYVALGSDVDRTACSIGATFYNLEGGVEIPMLPKTISEDAASLTPGKRRRGVTLIVDRKGQETFVLSWITVQHSYTYESADDGMDFGLTLSLEGNVDLDSHKMIETLMLRYNTAAARLLKKNGVGILRAQPAADAAKVLEWASVDPSLANEAATYVAVTDGVDTSHASLNVDAYCHASSPIRRYADLVNQRCLKRIIAGRGGPTDSGEAFVTHLNLRAKANRRWSRDLTFLTHVTPGRVHYIDIVWISPDQFWVPEWKRIVRARHQRPVTVGTDGVSTPVTKDTVAIFCDPTKRNWKSRILTAQGNQDTTIQDDLPPCIPNTTPA